MSFHANRIASVASRVVKSKPSKLVLDITPASASIKKKYQFLSSFTLQRPPLCMLPLTPFEREYEAYQQALQYSSSRGPFDATPITVKKILTDEGNLVIPTSDSTDPHNFTRFPHLKLYLLLQNKYTDKWEFPSVSYDGEASLIEHVKKSCATLFGDKVQLVHQGFIPLSHYHEHFSDRTTNPIGAKIFFYKAQWVSGDITLHNGFTDYAWLCEDELREQLGAARRIKYFEAVKPILDPS